MLLTLPDEVRQLLRLVQHHVFMIYRDEEECYFLFSEGMIAEQYNIPTRFVRNRTLTEIFTKHTYSVLYPNIVKAFNGISTQFEMMYRERTMLVSLEPIIRGKKIEEIMGSAFDITVQKEAQKELRAALDKERQLNALKSQFVYTVSHEFRTPLTGISMSAELLQHYMGRMDEHTKRRTLESILNRTNELTNLIEDLLTQSSAQSLTTMFNPEIIHPVIACQTIINDIADTFHPLSHVIEFSYEESLPVVHWDIRLMRHIIRNILTNAMKYSPTGTTILIRLYYVQGVIYVSIQDRGVGIADKDLPHIFTPFFRSNRTETVKGTGLGLSIVKEFVELHGGTIHAESQENQGTTFILAFPEL